ncbi:unnamed protein product [Lactuca saligna]|uniref:Exoribonuclease phosphorolytic domain-containing protein n=1 Tax=Lactuca saligna TaxID=75948 RepID=A0AA35VXS3_LACSI|nr:unnamed protein product [Lactuca saligna]
MQNISFMVQNTPVGRTRVSESKEVMESISNLSRSSDDWQYMGIDCLLLLLHVRLTYRPISVETGVIAQAYGSARVKMGKTEVIPLTCRLNLLTISNITAGNKEQIQYLHLKSYIFIDNKMVDADGEGLEKIQNLQSHDNNEIYEKAVKLLETYWLEEVDDAIPLGDAVATQPPAGFHFGDGDFPFLLVDSTLTEKSTLGRPSCSTPDKGNVSVYIDCSPTAAPQYKASSFGSNGRSSIVSSFETPYPQNPLGKSNLPG